MSVSNGLLILLIVISKPFALSQDGVHSKVESFGNFQTCLIENGINPSRIIVRSNGSEYTHLNYQWQLKPPVILPLAYILVVSSTDVSIVVRCGTKEKIRVVPKSGGHSFEKYSFGDENSVVVDLRHLIQVKVDEKEKTAVVGAGILLGPLSWALWKSGKHFLPSGFCPTVGISGIATGGGTGTFGRAYGLTSDHILEMEMVAANGSLLLINSELNVDLFWALRGGGSGSFGIITQFKFKIRPAPPVVFLGILKYNVSDLLDVLESWQTFTTNSPNNIQAEMIIAGGIIEISFLDSTGSEEGFEKVANEFPETQEKNGKLFSFPGFLFHAAKFICGQGLKPSVKFNEPSDLEHVTRESEEEIYVKRKSFFVDKLIRKEEVKAFMELVDGMPSTGMGLYALAYGGAINDVETNATAFVHRGNTLYNLVAAHKWNKKYLWSGPNSSEWLQEFFDVGKIIFDHRETYQNYVDGDLPDYLDRYYGSNLERLVQIKSQQDPENYFKFPQSIPVKLLN